MLKALIVDDEPLAHEVVLHHLKSHQDIDVVGQCYNATETLKWLAKSPVDLLFLDINMPALSGIELLKVIANRPQVIIITAYHQYALEGFELDVADYLMKPVSEHRFSQALDKVRKRMEKRFSELPKPQKIQSIILKVDREKCKFILEDIHLLEAYGNYVKVYYREKTRLVSSSLKKMIQQLPTHDFTQVHKSFVVNNHQVEAVDQSQLRLVGGKEIKIGKSFKQQAQKILTFN